MKCAIYVRVSTKKQEYETQLKELREYVERQGWQAVEYCEKKTAKTGSKRPELARLFEDARLHKVEVVVTWKIDRFGRSFSDFVTNVSLLDSYEVRFIALSQSIDTDKRNPLHHLR